MSAEQHGGGGNTKVCAMPSGIGAHVVKGGSLRFPVSRQIVLNKFQRRPFAGAFLIPAGISPVQREKPEAVGSKYGSGLPRFLRKHGGCQAGDCDDQTCPPNIELTISKHMA